MGTRGQITLAAQAMKNIRDHRLVSKVGWLAMPVELAKLFHISLGMLLYVSYQAN